MPTPVILPILGRQPDPDYLNVPVDVSQATLFDSMYLHPLIRDRLFLWSYYDVVIKTALWLISGTYHGQDQWVGGISKERYHASKGNLHQNIVQEKPHTYFGHSIFQQSFH